jgi:hypothetical protein
VGLKVHPEFQMLCLRCPVPGDCNESDPRCLVTLAKARGKEETRRPATPRPELPARAPAREGREERA